MERERTSAAASISACQAFLPCPSMVAAQIFALYFPLIKSAACKSHHRQFQYPSRS